MNNEQKLEAYQFCRQLTIKAVEKEIVEIAKRLPVSVKKETP